MSYGIELIRIASNNWFIRMTVSYNIKIFNLMGESYRLTSQWPAMATSATIQISDSTFENNPDNNAIVWLLGKFLLILEHSQHFFQVFLTRL